MKVRTVKYLCVMLMFFAINENLHGECLLSGYSTPHAYVHIHIVHADTVIIDITSV